MGHSKSSIKSNSPSENSKPRARYANLKLGWFVMVDSVEYELVNWERREVWKCQGQCGRFRHRKAVKGILAAICCGVPARLYDRYEMPVSFTILETLSPSGSTGQ